MSIHVQLGEPFCRSAGSRQVELELPAGESLLLSELWGRLQLADLWESMEEPPLFVLNERVLSHEQAAQAVVRDGDRLSVQLMLGGG